MIDGQWQASRLRDLPVERGVRLRGVEATRLDTFVDAAFAFAVTLLVISVDEVPDSYQGFIDALAQVPAFITCFALLMAFWWGHHAWSRRYGIRDAWSTTLSLVLVALVLIYVYPLRVIFGSFFANLSGGALPAGLELSLSQLGTLFVVFGLGFAGMSGVIMLLYLHARRCRARLLLDSRERFETLADAIAWAVMTATGLISALLAWVLPDAWSPLAGFVYWSLMLSMPLQAYLLARRRASLD